MGKAFAGLFWLVVVLALAGGVAYNYWEIGRLKAEIAELRAGRHSPSSAGGVVTKKDAARVAKEDEKNVTLQRHAERAQEFLRNQDYGAAKRELEAAAASIRQAGTDASDKTARTIDQLRRTVSDLSAQAEKLTGAAKQAMNGKQSGNNGTNENSGE